MLKVERGSTFGTIVWSDFNHTGEIGKIVDIFKS